MMATQGSYWTHYCQVVGRSPCTATSAYPVLPGSGMVGRPGDLGRRLRSAGPGQRHDRLRRLADRDRGYLPAV